MFIEPQVANLNTFVWSDVVISLVQAVPGSKEVEEFKLSH